MGYKLKWPFSKKDKEKKKGPKTVSIFLGFFFMVNYCLGTGFLGVPFSFFYAGYLASIPTLLLIAFVSWNNAEWTIETMARAQVAELCVFSYWCVLRVCAKFLVSSHGSCYITVYVEEKVL